MPLVQLTSVTIQKNSTSTQCFSHLTTGIKIPMIEAILQTIHLCYGKLANYHSSKDLVVKEGYGIYIFEFASRIVHRILRILRWQ